MPTAETNQSKEEPQMKKIMAVVRAALMLMMMVCAVGTEFDLHAYMVSKPLDENLQPSAAGFHPRANARRPQPDF